MAKGFRLEVGVRPDPMWLHALLVAALPAALFIAMGNQLDGDTYHYVEYWNKLRAGILHTNSLHEAAPKPIPVLLFGVTNEIFGNPGPLVGLSIAMGALASACAARCMHLLFGLLAARICILAVALDSLFVRGMLEGSSAVMELLFLAAALLVLMQALPRAHLMAGLLLLAAGLCRPEVWPLFALLAAGVPIVVPESSRRRVGLMTAIALLAPILWLAFDRLLTGDALFSFRDTLTYSSRHDGSAPSQEGILTTALLYTRRAVTTLVEAMPGPALLLGGAGLVLLARSRPRLGLALGGTLVAIIGFYFLPYRSGLPLLSRFLLVPIVVITALTGAALACMANACCGVREEQAQVGRALRALTVLLLAGVASLHSVDGLRRWTTGLGRFHASRISELTKTLQWLEQQDPNLRERKLIVAARRKGMVVVQLGLSADQVTSFERIETLLGRSKLQDYDYLLLDVQDFQEVYRGPWEGIESAPSGFEELRAPLSNSTLRVFRSQSLDKAADRIPR